MAGAGGVGLKGRGGSGRVVQKTWWARGGCSGSSLQRDDAAD